MALTGSLPSTCYKFDSYTSITKYDSSWCKEENSKDGKYLLVNDRTYVFCYRETFEPGNVFLPIPKYVSMNDIFKPSLYMSLMLRVSTQSDKSDKVDLPEAVFNVLTLTGRRLVVCDYPGLFKIVEKVPLRLTSLNSNRDDRTEDCVLEDETVQLKIPTAATEKNLLMFPLKLSSGQEQTFRKNQFLTIIRSDLAKHGFQFWTDMRSFRPDPVIDSDTIGKYHPFPRSKLDLFFMPRYRESRPGGSPHRQFGSGVLFCDTSCHHSDIEGASIQSPDCPNLLNRAMKEAFIIGAEVATYALTHHKRFSVVAKLDIEVYLLIMSMIVDEAQILHMELKLGDAGSNYIPAYRLSSTTTRRAAFNDLMNFLKEIKT